MEVSALHNKMTFGRRLRTCVLFFILAATAFGCASETSSSDASYDFSSGMHVIMTGTGKGPYTIEGGAGVAVLVDGRLLQFDAGPKTKAHLDELGVLKDYRIEYLFFTHLHADHTTDFFDMYAWADRVFGADLKVFGPRYTRDMTDTAREFLFASLADEAAIRRHFQLEERDASSDPRIFEVEEIVGDGGVVLDDGVLRVTAVRTPHAVAEDTGSYAYRLDSRHGSVVISGDTAPSLDVVKLADRADILVHEASHPDPEMAPEMYAIARHVKLGDDLSRYREDLPVVHSTPREVGKVAAMADVKVLITYHTTYGKDGSLRREFIEAIKENFEGELVLGRPLLVMPVGVEGGRVLTNGRSTPDRKGENE